MDRKGRKMRFRSKQTCFIATFILLLAGMILLQARKNIGCKLPNGTELYFGGITYGKSHVFHPNGAVGKIWSKILPADFPDLQVAGVSLLSPVIDHSLSARGSSPSDKLRVWLIHKNTAGSAFIAEPTGNDAPGLLASLSTADGVEWMAAPRSFQQQALNADESTAVSSWEYRSFPRRGKILTFRIYQYFPEESRKLLAEFTFTNRFQAEHPVWMEQKPPISTNWGDLALTLLQAVSTQSRSTEKSGHLSATQMKFKFSPNVPSIDEWIPVSISAKDATGNQLELVLGKAEWNEEQVCTVVCTPQLPPNEVWEIKILWWQRTATNSSLPNPSTSWDTAEPPEGNISPTEPGSRPGLRTARFRVKIPSLESSP